ncbi:hypothetical protein ACFS4T_15500 [Pseudomonas lini]
MHLAHLHMYILQRVVLKSPDECSTSCLQCGISQTLRSGESRRPGHHRCIKKTGIQTRLFLD